MYSTKDVTKYLNITRTTYYRLLVRYEIQPYRTIGGHYRLDEMEFKKLKQYYRKSEDRIKKLNLLKNQIRKRVFDIYDNKVAKILINEIDALLDKGFSCLNEDMRLNKNFRL